MTDSLSEAFSGVLKMGLEEVMAANVNRIFVPLQRFNQARGDVLQLLRTNGLEEQEKMISRIKLALRELQKRLEVDSSWQVAMVQL